MKDPSRSSSSNMTFSNDIILTNQFNMEDNPFAEYMWMENEEEFNRQVEEELWEEDFIERCFQEMLEEEELLEWFIPSRDLPSSYSSSSYSSSSQAVSQLQEQINLLVLGGAGGGGGGGGADQEPVVNGNLSPNAEEFTPAVQKHMV